MKRYSILPSAPCALALALALSACGASGGGGSDTDVPDGTTGTTAPLTDALAAVPVVGELAASCEGAALEIVDTVIVGSPLGGALEGVPVLGELLVSGDPSAVPVLGGLLTSIDVGQNFLPLSAGDAQALLPAAFDLSTLPVIGALPTVCGDVAGSLVDVQAVGVPVVGDLVPDPGNLLGLIPVFGAGGDPIATLLAFDATGSTPLGALPLPGDQLDLLAPVSSVLDPILGLLGGLLP